MSRLFEYESDCPPVEKIMWGKTAGSCGYFEGVKELSLEELYILKGALEQQIMMKHMKGEG
jgi:hypothetical protein